MALASINQRSNLPFPPDRTTAPAVAQTRQCRNVGWLAEDRIAAAGVVSALAEIMQSHTPHMQKVQRVI